MRFVAFLFASAVCLLADAFPPAEVKIVGDVDYGQTSSAMECGEKPGYCAVLFNGTGGDKVEVTVSGDRKAFVAFADQNLTELARGTDHLTFTLPSANKDLQAYYIVFRGEDKKSGQFTVALKKVEK